MSTIYIDNNLLGVVKHYADQENRSVSNFTTNILTREVEKRIKAEARKKAAHNGQAA